MRDIRTLCDRCLNPGAEPYEIPTGRWAPCPAGGKSEDIVLTADLCPRCTAQLLTSILAQLVAGLPIFNVTVGVFKRKNGTPLFQE